jgi:hypothetical protein
MYLFDPDRGRSRRAQLGQKLIRAGHVTQREAGKQIRNAGHHLIGRMHELRSSLRDRFSNIDDDILLDRVRAQIGRDVRHLGMLDLRIENGCVVAEGPVLRGETEKLRRKLLKVRGVRDCDLRVEEVPKERMERLSGQRGFSPQRVAM